MNLVSPEVKLLDIKDPELKLERCMRICYKSEDKICEGSAAKLIKAITAKGHLSTTEHFRIHILCDSEIESAIRNYQDDHKTAFIRILDIGDDYYSYTLDGNIRAFYEIANDTTCPDLARIPLLQCLHEVVPSMVPDQKAQHPDVDFDSAQYAGESEDYFTVKIITDRGVLGQIARHRTLSPSVESTRYCNYLDRGISMCLPEPFLWAPCEGIDEWIYMVTDWWFNNPDFETKIKDVFITEDGQILHRGIVELVNLAKRQSIWQDACSVAEVMYNRMVMTGATPQEARTVLPMSHKVELVLTGTYDAWEHFIELRMDKAADPQIRIIAEKIDAIKWHHEAAMETLRSSKTE